MKPTAAADRRRQRGETMPAEQEIPLGRLLVRPVCPNQTRTAPLKRISGAKATNSFPSGMNGTAEAELAAA